MVHGVDHHLHLVRALVVGGRRQAEGGRGDEDDENEGPHLVQVVGDGGYFGET